MADSFQNPANQADLNALRAALQKLDTEVVGMKDQLSAELAAVRADERAAQAARRETGAPISSSPATGSLEAQQKLIDQQVLSYQALNEQIRIRIGLEADAAAAAQRTAAAGGGLAAESVAAQADRALAALQARGGLGFQAAGSVQRVRNAISTGEIDAEGAAAGKASGALNELSAAQERAAASARLLAAGEINAREGLAAAALTAQELDNKLATTGALSSTALGALSNGTISLREMGHQLTETIGKFGGWTLAAGAVYGVLGALNEVRQGAVDTSSALTGMTKFLPAGALNIGSARQQLVQQAQATATPLNEVGDTAQQFAKVFKTQGDVFTATHVALTAAKLDNLSLADSYRYLTAIVQETGVGVGQLPRIFDQITAAQDKLGARVSQLLPAYAGSIGAVQTSNGDPSQLLGLEALAITRTGRSGSQIGTAFARGATNFFPTAKSRGILERYGVDPNQGFTQALVEAMQVANQKDLSGGERRQLSTAFFGTRFGSYLTTLFKAPLSGPHGLDTFLSQTAAGAYPGLANKQLATTVSQPNSQLQLLKVNLQAIGAELSGSAFTSPFGLMLKATNDMLEYSTKLMAVWDGLPGPLKETASYLAIAAATIATMRRFNIGQMMANSSSPIAQFLSPVFTRSPEAQLKSQVNAAMSSLGTNLDTQIASSSQRYVASQIELTRAQDELAALDAQGARGSEAYIAALARAAAATDAAAAAATDITELQAVRSPASMAAIRATMMGGPGARPVGAEGPLLENGAFFAAQEEAAAETTRLSSAVALAGSGLSFLASNAIPLAIGAFMAFALIKQESQATHGAEIGAINQLENAKTPAQVRAAVSAYYGAGTIPTPFGNVSNIPSAQGDPSMHQAARAQLGYIKGLQIEQNAALDAYGQAQQLAAEGRMKDAYHQMQTDMAFKSLGSIPVPTPFGGTMNVSYADALKQALVGYEGKAVGGKVNPFLMWEQAGQDLTNQLVPELQSYGSSADVYGAKSGGMKNLIAGYAYMVEKFGKNPLDVQSMQALSQAGSSVTGVMDKQVSSLTNLAQMSTTNKGQAGYYQQALSAVNTAEQQIRSMFGAAEKLPGADVGKLKEAEQQLMGLVAQKRQSTIQSLLQLAQSETALNVSSIIGVGPGYDLERAIAQLRGLQSQLGQAQKMGADAKTINDLQTQVNNQAQTVLQDRINYWSGLAQVNTAIQTAQTADPIQQTQDQINQLNQLLAHYRAMGMSPNSLTYRTVVGQIAQLGQTQVSNQISQQQAVMQTGLSQQNIGAPQQVVLQNNLAEAQRFLAYLKSLPANQVNPITMQAAIKAVYDAQGAMAQWAIQQGSALISAEAALKEGGTFDPVQIAMDELQKAQQLLAYDLAHNAPHAQIVQDQATVKSDMKAKLEAEWQKTDSTIMFLMNTYQITQAQALQRLQDLYKKMKAAGASYTDLQNIYQQIFQIEFGQSNLNLNTGAMHMPSTYEVKAAIRRGAAGMRRQTTAGMLAEVQTNVKMTVNVHRDADVRKVTKAIKDALGVSIDGLGQAAGLT